MYIYIYINKTIIICLCIYVVFDLVLNQMIGIKYL